MIELRLPTAKKSFEARPRKGMYCYEIHHEQTQYT